jgi:hypothetical protein
MSRTVFPFAVGDISALARRLNTEIGAREAKPGHLELLNMLARGAGFRNFQHFRAAATAQDRLEQLPAVPEVVDHARVEQAARHFDGAGRLVRWPAKVSHQALCLWVLWSKLAPRQAFTEAQINKLLQAQHLFGDYAILRREMFGYGLVSRTRDGREYRRVERQPTREAVELLRRVRGRAPAG